MSSIQWRLTVRMALVCALLWAVGSGAAYISLRAGLLSEFDETLATSAQGLTTMTERGEDSIKFEVTEELLAPFIRSESPDYYQFFLPDGRTLARSASLAKHNLLQGPAGPGNARFWNIVLPDGRRGRAAILRFLPKQDEEVAENPSLRHAEVTVVVARHRDGLDRLLSRLAATLLLVGAFMLLTIGVVSAIVVRRGLGPLSELAARVAEIDASSLGVRFAAESMPAELVPIAERLNDSLQRLEASFARERRFSADAAHELRTPIAELRALAEVALKWPEDRDNARIALEEALAIALQMESIAAGLLAMTRCEAGVMPALPERVLLAPMISSLWEAFDGQARSKRLTVTLNAPEGIAWNTDPTGLRLILRNFLSNAVEYTPVNGVIRLAAENGPGPGRIRISNTTDNLAPEDLPHLFERFWRKDPARSSSVHCGLGLAQAKAYADLLHLGMSASLASANELTIVLSESEPTGMQGAPRM